MTNLTNTFTSTGAKFFFHQEAMRDLRNGKGHPIVCHVMLTDRCNHECAFCSVQTREGNTLAPHEIFGFLCPLQERGLKAVILSGGGNPILYRHKSDVTGITATFNDIVRGIHAFGLEIGLITNGMPLELVGGRKTWKGIEPEVLDMLTWCRISCSGFDHKENAVFVPDFDPSKTTLGFSYVLHDTYYTPDEPNHGQVSTYADALPYDVKKVWRAEERIEHLTEQLTDLVKDHRPAYLRLLPNCLEPKLIPHRVEQLKLMASEINLFADNAPAFVQYKPPSAPKACYLGYIHPVLNTDGFVYPCDSCVLNEAADHKFANPWRVCHWSEVDKIYEAPVRSLIADPSKTCPGCVFSRSNEILLGVVDGSADLTPPTQVPQHANFV